MNNRTVSYVVRSWGLRIATIIVALFGSSACTTSKAAERSSTEVCLTNLTEVWWLLHRWVGEGDTFPPHLGSLAGYTTNRNLFSCPAVRRNERLVGSLTNVDEWTDYIYVANQRDVPPLDVPILICPPENHDGQNGCVVWKWGGVQCLSADRIRALVARPWCMVTNATELQKQYLKRDIVVIVPERLRRAYPEAYRAKQSDRTQKSTVK